MRERVRHFDGQLELESNEHGTTISAKFPPTANSPSLEEPVKHLEARGQQLVSSYKSKYLILTITRANLRARTRSLL
jgi:hypothetical protein